jgi:hypothetical protein
MPAGANHAVRPRCTMLHLALPCLPSPAGPCDTRHSGPLRPSLACLAQPSRGAPSLACPDQPGLALRSQSGHECHACRAMPFSQVRRSGPGQTTPATSDPAVEPTSPDVPTPAMPAQPCVAGTSHSKPSLPSPVPRRHSNPRAPRLTCPAQRTSDTKTRTPSDACRTVPGRTGNATPAWPIPDWSTAPGLDCHASTNPCHRCLAPTALPAGPEQHHVSHDLSPGTCQTWQTEPCHKGRTKPMLPNQTCRAEPRAAESEPAYKRHACHVMPSGTKQCLACRECRSAP